VAGNLHIPFDILHQERKSTGCMRWLCFGAGRPGISKWAYPSSSVDLWRGAPFYFQQHTWAFHSNGGRQTTPSCQGPSLLLLLQNMPSLGCVQGFAPRFDLDTTEHDLRTHPSMSQQLLDYLSRGESQVSDRAPRPVIRPTAAAEPPRCAPTGPDAYFHRCVNFDFPPSESLLI
jgi:hypothetical protein